MKTLLDVKSMRKISNPRLWHLFDDVGMRRASPLRASGSFAGYNAAASIAVPRIDEVAVEKDRPVSWS